MQQTWIPAWHSELCACSGGAALLACHPPLTCFFPSLTLFPSLQVWIRKETRWDWRKVRVNLFMWLRQSLRAPKLARSDCRVGWLAHRQLARLPLPPPSCVTAPQLSNVDVLSSGSTSTARSTGWQFILLPYTYTQKKKTRVHRHGHVRSALVP